MSKSDVLNWFSGNIQQLSVSNIIAILCISVIVGMVIFVTYRLAYRGVVYNVTFNISNIALVVISATIMLMISSNIVISLGMVGALSIVRFRTAIKDPQDTVYIFWAVVEGLCVGAGMYLLAFLSAFIIACLMLAASFYEPFYSKYLIVLRGSAFDESEIQKILSDVYKKYRIRSVNSEETHKEMVCEITSKDAVSKDVIQELMSVEGVVGADWLLETGAHLG